MFNTIGEVVIATKGQLIKGNSEDKTTGIMTRSNEVKKGQVYFDIVGGKVGNDKITVALQRGAKAVIVSRHKLNQLPIDDPAISVISVPHVGRAFWNCIKYYRDHFDIPMVGVTGSSGKTTTKEMIYSVFRRKWKKVLKTIQNQNLPSFIPEHIMRLNATHQAAVFEVGMRLPGQVGKQSEVIKPFIGVITNIGQAHVGNFAGKDKVIEEKASIMVGIPRDGYLLINADDENSKKIDLSNFIGKVLRFGIENEADFTAFDIKTGVDSVSFKTIINNKEELIQLPIPGRHNVYNALATIAVANLLGIETPLIKQGLARYRRPKYRLQLVDGIRDSLLINDCYNANPDSVIAGLQVLKELAQTRDRTSVAVLANMLEQGMFTREAHQRVGEKVQELGIDYLITVGSLAKRIAEGAIEKGMDPDRIQCFDRRYQASFYLRRKMPDNAVCLFKGSRAVYLEKTVEFLTDKKKDENEVGK